MKPNMVSEAPLLTRNASDPIAIIGKALPEVGLCEGVVTAADFLSQVHCIAERLPAHQYVVNFCENRYLFTLVFCASILRGQTNLLPPNKKELTQERLQERYDDLYIAHDLKSDDGLLEKLPRFDLVGVDLSQCRPLQATEFCCPNVNLEHLAAISFTSGSTGDSQPNFKSWQTIVESTRINARHMLAGYNDVLYQLATVPPQHMWGLETSVLLPLFDPVCVADAKPLFPQDILDLLNALPQPRMLVSAPVHLRALLVSQLSYPQVKLVLCATSPLSVDLAKQIEALFTGEDNHLPGASSELREVYGCSEVGSMAVRNTASEEYWQLFDGIHLNQQDGVTLASTAYLPQSVSLQDNIIVAAGGRFKLDGRASDMVDIAGKRGSLLELNKVLLDYPGIIDGVIFTPPTTGSSSEKQNRLAALVVLPKQDSIRSLRDYLSEHFDDAFIPRPIIQVDALPREENGKLPVRRLNEFYQRVKSTL